MNGHPLFLGVTPWHIILRWRKVLDKEAKAYTVMDLKAIYGYGTSSRNTGKNVVPYGQCE